MDVVIVGSCMTDLVSIVPRLPKVGETLHGDAFSIGFGGKGANQCVMAARLGAKTAMIGKVGNDSFGQNTIKNFKDNSVNADHVGITKKAFSGVATISVVAETGENSIVIVAGANMCLSEEDIQEAESVITSSKVLACQLEISPAATLAALRIAKKNNVITILNPAPAIADLDADIYANTDIICLNESEAEIMTGIAVSSVNDAQSAADELIRRGCRVVIVTLGAQGSVYVTQDHPSAVHVPTRCVQAVDTTGAGDAFIGALAFYLARQRTLPLHRSIERANEIAARSVLARGTQSSFPLRNELPDELFFN